MNIEVSTRSYLASHGRQPKGYGLWAFFLDFKDDGTFQSIWYVPHSMPYGEAKKLAKKAAKARGSDYVVVAP